jgi:hypothetical protein
LIYELENFLSLEVCSDIISYFESTTDRNTHIDGYFKSRSLCPYKIIDPEIKRSLLTFQTKCIQTVSKLYYPNNLNVNLYLEYWDIVKWEDGKDMEVHQDGIEYEYGRDYSSVCYLNDDYTGGETFFPENQYIEYICKPKKGKIVFFPSSRYHGVKTVKNGVRYSLPCWYSKNPKDIFLQDEC